MQAIRIAIRIPFVILMLPVFIWRGHKMVTAEMKREQVEAPY